MRYLMLLLLLPFCARAQNLAVESKVSRDYLDLIKNTTEQPRDSTVHVTRYLDLSKKKMLDFGMPIQYLGIKNNMLSIGQKLPMKLGISGNYSTSVEIKNINQIPALQTKYVQGRQENGSAIWQGPETGEVFSYGPDINTLEYNGSSYPYDIKGKLVQKGAGNGQAAGAYSNNIFRTGISWRHSLVINGNLVRGYYQPSWNFNLKLSEGRESTTLQQNRNTNNSFSLKVNHHDNFMDINGQFQYSNNKYSNSNRNGFQNRLYQGTILTPISFDNKQGTMVGIAQRNFGAAADNPYFLLENNANSFNRSQMSGGLVLTKKTRHLDLDVRQSIQRVKEGLWEVYKFSTAGLSDGSITNRNKIDDNYNLSTQAAYHLFYSNTGFKSTIAANYLLNTSATSIDYVKNEIYRYERTTQDMSIGFRSVYNHYDLDAGIDLMAKAYISTTAANNKWLQPQASVFLNFKNFLHRGFIKFTSSFNRFYSELPISGSLAYTNSLHYSSDAASGYIPNLEVKNYNGVQAVDHKEFTAGIEISSGYHWTLGGSVFTKNTLHDIFPTYKNGEMILENVADHRNTGIDVQLTYNGNKLFGSTNASTSHTVSFFTYNNTVTDVANGYNAMPIAGFSNVYKAVIKGQPFGVIMGSTYARDASDNIRIGTHGFPLMDTAKKIIGDPTPDFILKMSHVFRWKKVAFSLDWEWRKGGDIWNGTQAVLDYYGRSETSATQRSISGHVFAGTAPDGHPNTVPVRFNDANQPLEQNRWVRYGPAGIAEAYVEKGSCLRINNINCSYTIPFKKYIQKLVLSARLSNLVVWSAYNGVDVSSALYEQDSGNGLDFFNLPSNRSFGLNASIQF